MAEKIFRRILTLTILSVLILFGGCGGGTRTRATEEPTTPQEREKAQLLGTIDRNFDNPQAHYELGQLHQQEGQWAKAQYEYNIALSFDPAHRQSRAATITTLIAMGDQAKADMTSDLYISQTSGSSAESLRLGLAFQKEKLDDLALRAYQQAIRLNPNSAKVNRQIGYYYLSKGDKIRAKDYLYRSFQLNRKQSDVAGELGRLGVDISGARLEKPNQLDKIVTDADKQRQQQ